MPDLQLGIPQRIKKAGDRFGDLRGKLTLVNEKQIQVRLKAKITPAITA